MFKDKTIVLGVTGSIAAYKMANLASMLVKKGCQVYVIMTKNATNFIHPITFETLTGHKCLVDTFDRNFEFQVKHISLAEQADVMLIAPASANIIGKMANGIADDMLSTTFLACKAPVLVSPAMNTNMFENAIVQDNITKLRNYGLTIVEPDSGRLACGSVGKGKLPSEEILLRYIEAALVKEKDLLGKKLLVTAGPTQEAIDPVRYISNHSSGKMGYAIAKMAALRGAEVTLVSGMTQLETPLFVKRLDVTSASDMFEVVSKQFVEQDIVIKAAAVADYTPVYVAEQKVKKKDEDLTLELERTTDILKYLGEHKQPNQFLCGFAMETENLLENAKGKLVKKNLDLIVANSLSVEGAGFQGDTNVVTLISKNEMLPLPKLSKEEVANRLLDKIIENM